ncbi:hypothetical protein AJ80_03213 [Polytolypa hystricis UAMH7299]|uniref:Uncharacterized protein n=1 Tax=Polytolypa hystricis (strain UAMH7299) TaxID=1447883 RepID=A0A2B7YKQ1_POLH7|nr:hypothetical protein AJ80_03213 [Polytolypa hystricis UAMH7299]
MLARHIRYRRLTITRFLDSYRKNVRRYHQSFPGGGPSAMSFFAKCLQIRSDPLPKYHEEFANDNNNYANLLSQESRTPEVLAEAECLYLRAIEIDAQHRYKEAIETIEKGRYYAVRALGVGGHWDASASYQVGNVLYAQEKWEATQGHFERALDLFTAENPLHPTA